MLGIVYNFPRLNYTNYTLLNNIMAAEAEHIILPLVFTIFHFKIMIYISKWCVCVCLHQLKYFCNEDRLIINKKAANLQANEACTG